MLEIDQVPHFIYCHIHVYVGHSITCCVAPPCEWYRLTVSQPEIAKKSTKPTILAFKVIQGHWIRRQSRASVRLPISY